jgi:hypothetical protein
MRPPHPPRKSLRLHKFLTILGTLILFLTFVVKDGLRDRVKDELAAIQAAQAEYWSEKYHEEEMEAIRRGRIKRRSAELVSKVPAADHSDDTADSNPTISEVKASSEPYLDKRTDLEVEDADLLFVQMSSDREAQDAREKAYSEMEKLHKLRDSVQLEFQSIPPDADKIPATPKLRDLVDSLATQWDASDGAAKQYVEKTITHAESLQSSRQHRYDLFTKWSYVLYTVGAVVILAGKLIEREADPADIESLQNGE